MLILECQFSRVVRFVVLEDAENFFEDGAGFAQHLIVPKAEGAIAARPKPCVASLVLFNIPAVLSAVDFDDELAIGAQKIDDERTDWGLAAEFVPAMLSVS